MRRKFWLAALMMAIIVPEISAQGVSLPRLPSDAAVKKAQLPDGMEFYLCTNRSGAGLMNISLVQKAAADVSIEKLTETARKHFSEVYFSGSSFETFLSRAGVVPGPEGYISVTSGSVTYNFNDFSTDYGEDVQDSLLLGIFSLAKLACADGLSSSSQAIVIAGDVDSRIMPVKLRLLSLLSPKVPGQAPAYPYMWEQPEEGSSPVEVSGGRVPVLSVSWSLARTPLEYMPTVLPVVSDKLAGELGWVLRRRIYSAFREQQMAANVIYRHTGSSDGVGDERISLMVRCPGADAEKARRLLDRELRRLRTWGVGEVEYTYARDAQRNDWHARANDLAPSNASFVRRCRANFLYGASLAAENLKMKAVYKDLPDSVQTRLFNNYLRGLLTQSSAVDSTLAPAPSLQRRDSVKAILDSYLPKLVLKAPPSREEKLTGGQIWTFSNKVNVIYKRMDTKGMVYYSFCAKGCREHADINAFNDIEGVYAESLGNYLSSLGVQLRPRLTPTDVRLEGRAPYENFEYALKTMIAFVSKDENVKSFGPDTYKLLVIVGDKVEDEVRRSLAKYISGLRPGSKWTSGNPVQEENAAAPGVPFVQRDVTFKLEMTAPNYAVSRVAYYALREAMARQFSGWAGTLFLESGFVGFPIGSYRVVCGARALSPGCFSASAKVPSREDMDTLLQKAIHSLALEQVTAGQLDCYKALARKSFLSYKATPQYYIDLACNRYLDNRNLTAGFDSSVGAVKAADIQKFFHDASAAAADR